MGRRTKLERILERFDNAYVRFSETFSDPERLLAKCERRGIEGIVSQAQGCAIPVGEMRLVKTKVWREANKSRGELFNP